MGYSASGYILSTGANNYRQSCKNVEKPQSATTTITTTATTNSVGFSPITVLPDDSLSNLSRVKKVACGREHTMMLLHDGRLYGIGHNQHGQIYGKESTFTSFTLIPTNLFLMDAGDKIIDVYCTQINTYVVTAQGHVYWSGWENSSAEKTYLKIHTPNNVSSLRIDRFVTNSNAVHCFVICGGKVYGIGWNSNGQLGVGNRNDSYGSLAIVPFDARQINCLSTGAQFSVLATETELYGCGTNGDLQLSTSYSGTEVFTQITTPFSGQKIRQVVCGGFHTLVQLENNEIWGCGKFISNDFTKLKIFEPVCAIGAGWQFFICLGESGSMYAAGENNNGQLGTDEIDSSSQLKTIPPCREMSIPRRTLIECGEFYSIAYLSNDDKSHFLFTYSILKKLSSGVPCLSDIEIKAFH